MATLLDIGAISIPDADFPDVQAALKLRYASVGVPNPTNAQILEDMRQEVIAMIKSVTRQYRLSQATITDPAAT
jgi:hypothetical protein